jgi:NhaA family Na+:H+ antiporter
MLGVKLKLASWPKGVGPQHVLTAGMIGGIGFTMSLFLIEQSLTTTLAKSAAKIAILSGSALAALAGAAMMAAQPAKDPQIAKAQ